MPTEHAPTQATHLPKPILNVSDLPELVQPTRRRRPCLQPHLDQLEKRGATVYQEVSQHQAAVPTAVWPPNDARIAVAELISMFPMFEPQLIQAIVAEAATLQHAMETLLALAAAVMEPVIVSRDDPSQCGGGPLSHHVRVKIHEHFPLLVDADGWQVTSPHASAWNLIGTAVCSWSDRAKHAAKLQAPQVDRPKELSGAVPWEPSDLDVVEEGADETKQYDIDDEYWQSKVPGQRREQRRARHSKDFHRRHP